MNKRIGYNFFKANYINEIDGSYNKYVTISCIKKCKFTLYFTYKKTGEKPTELPLYRCA
jgi:hypothetical protein